MADTRLLLLLLVAVCAAIVLLVVRLLRKPGLALEAALREEQRDGRGELRQQLDSLSRAQAQRIEGFGARLTDFSTRARPEQRRRGTERVPTSISSGSAKP